MFELNPDELDLEESDPRLELQSELMSMRTSLVPGNLDRTNVDPSLDRTTLEYRSDSVPGDIARVILDEFMPHPEASSADVVLAIKKRPYLLNARMGPEFWSQLLNELATPECAMFWITVLSAIVIVLPDQVELVADLVLETLWPWITCDDEDVCAPAIRLAGILLFWISPDHENFDACLRVVVNLHLMDIQEDDLADKFSALTFFHRLAITDSSIFFELIPEECYMTLIEEFVALHETAPRELDSSDD
jgi:hypothetical protein